MCKELDEEIQRGKEAMIALANHLTEMGADELKQTVSSKDGVLVMITGTVVSRV